MTSSTNEVTLPSHLRLNKKKKKLTLKDTTEQISSKLFDYLCGVAAALGDFYTRYKKSLGK